MKLLDFYISGQKPTIKHDTKTLKAIDDLLAKGVVAVTAIEQLKGVNHEGVDY